MSTNLDFLKKKMLYIQYLTSGLGIRSLVFQVIRVFFVSEMANRSFVMSNLSKLLTVALLKRTTGVNCSSRSLKKSE